MGSVPSKLNLDFRRTDNEENFSFLIHKIIQRQANHKPFKTKCIIAYHKFYNNVIHKRMLKLFVKDTYWFDRDWGEIVGSYAEGTCVNSSDIDFMRIQPDGPQIYACPGDIPSSKKRALVVYTEDDRIPPGYCWLRVYDTTRRVIAGFTNGLEWSFYKGYKQIPEKCLAKAVDGHTHYPYKSELDKKVCFAASYIQHTDGHVYYSRAVISDYMCKRGLTSVKAFNLVLPKWSSHGPAFKQAYFGIFNVDVVFCSRCYSSWPVCAKEWETRQRYQQWPRKELIHDIVNSGFEVVPMPSKITLAPDADFEWRLSFRSAETKLVRSFNMCQRDCFIALKILAKEYVGPRFPDEDFLSSYIIKTLMFWSIEELDDSLWKQEDMLHCLHLCLNVLREWIENGFCPNYFIPTYNLFRTKLERMFRFGFREWFMANVNDWRVLLRCKSFKDLNNKCNTVTCKISLV